MYPSSKGSREPAGEITIPPQLRVRGAVCLSCKEWFKPTHADISAVHHALWDEDDVDPERRPDKYPFCDYAMYNDIDFGPDNAQAMAARNAYQDIIWEMEAERSTVMVNALASVGESTKTWATPASSRAIEHAIREASKKLRRAIAVVGYKRLDERVLDAVAELEHALSLRPLVGVSYSRVN